MGDGPYSEEDWAQALLVAEEHEDTEARVLKADPCPMFNGYLKAMRESQLRRGIDIDDMLQYEFADHMRAMALGLLTEAAEVVESFQWKPWKMAYGFGEGSVVDHEDTADEVCDLLHFLGHLCALAGIDDDMLNDAMRKCIDKNTRRVNGAYSY